MGYELDALIGHKSVIVPAATGLETTCVVYLGADMAMIPLVDTNRNLRLPPSEAGPPPSLPANASGVPEGLTPRVDAWCRDASRRGPLAYISAFYFGGDGEQGGAVWEDGELVWGPESGHGIINRVLRRLGVEAVLGADEFDTVGLWQRRKTEQWVAEASRLPVEPAVPLFPKLWTRIELPPPTAEARRYIAEHTNVYESVGHKVVLELRLSGAETEEMLRQQASTVLREEVKRARPQRLVFNLLELRLPEQVYGPVLLGFLVSGLECMYALGAEEGRVRIVAEGRVRIVATGSTAGEIERLLKVTQLHRLFGNHAYPDVESALSAPVETGRHR